MGLECSHNCSVLLIGLQWACTSSHCARSIRGLPAQPSCCALATCVDECIAEMIKGCIV